MHIVREPFLFGLCSEAVAVQLAEAVAQQDDLALQAIVVDSDRKELKDRVDRDDHRQRLCLDAELREQD